MRVLHLFSNFKWTGPAEPAVSLAARLVAAGVEVVFCSSGFTKGAASNPVARKAAERGLAPRTDLHLSKHRSPVRDRADVRGLRGLLAREGFDAVHTHLSNDFRIACRARGRSGGPPVVRTIYETDPEGLDGSDLRRVLGEADGVLVFSRVMERHLLSCGLEGSRLWRIDPGVDLERFDPGRELPDLRPSLGFGPCDFLAGIVARVQPQRRFDLLLEAAQGVASRCPAFRLAVIGRGSKLDRVAREPARRRGLLDRFVFFPGYFSGDDYAAVLRMLDVEIYLVPGTDGTSRAVCEALASGCPVVASRRGMLAELVRDGRTGILVDERPEALAGALLDLHADPARRRRMGSLARRDASERFDPRLQAAAVRRVYEAVARPGTPAPGGRG